jgi:anti-sigma regulatory factor (Ser/Thr protein kinase)
MGRRYLRRLQRLVEQLLDLSRMRVKSGKAFGEPWHMTPVVNQTVEAFRTLAEQRGLGLQSKLENGWTTTCRQEFVEKILLNLLNNAIRYTGRGGTVVVTLAGQGEEVRLEVADDGPGIPPGEQHLIFERFHRLPASENDSSRGAGIGLALVREATQAMKGRLELESDEGQGSRFRIYLAARRRPDAGVDGEPVDRDRLLLETESLVRSDRSGQEPIRSALADPEGTVLVVEDNADLRRHLVDMLAGQWRTIAAGNGREGLEAARVSCARPDCQRHHDARHGWTADAGGVA